MPSSTPSSPSPSYPLKSFPLFPLLLLEIRLRIFHFSTLLHPRTIDISTAWKKCTYNNNSNNKNNSTIFYIQSYSSVLSADASTPPAPMSVSREARRECERSYGWEFESVMSVCVSVSGSRSRCPVGGARVGEVVVEGEVEGKGEGKSRAEVEIEIEIEFETDTPSDTDEEFNSGKQEPDYPHPQAESQFQAQAKITVTLPPTLLLNPQIDTLIPRGFWNIISFSDFTNRITSVLEVQSIAIDVRGCFWRENLRDYCRMKSWVLNGVGEVLLFDGGGGGEIRGSGGGVRRGKGSGELERLMLDDGEGGKFLEMKFVDLDLDLDLDVERELERLGGRGEGGMEPEREKDEQRKEVRDVAKFLNKVFDVIENETDVEGDEEFGLVRKAEFVPMEQTEKSEFRRPVIRLVRLVTEIVGK